MIERVQPYHRRQGGVLLSILGELSNADKHRVVNPAFMPVLFTPPVVVPPSAPITLEMQYTEPMRMEDRAVYARITKLHVPPGTKVNVNLNPSFNIAFGKWGEYEISTASLFQLRDYISVLVRRFSREF